MSFKAISELLPRYATSSEWGNMVASIVRKHIFSVLLNTLFGASTKPEVNMAGIETLKVLTHSLTHLLTYSLTHSLTHPLTYSLTHLLTYSLTHFLKVLHQLLMTNSSEKVWKWTDDLNKREEIRRILERF
jgi:hypothetical protein